MFNPLLLRKLLGDDSIDNFNPTGDVTNPQPGAPGVTSPIAKLAPQDTTGTDQSEFSKINYDTPMLRKYQSFISNPPQPIVPTRGKRILAAIAAMGAGAGPAGMGESGPVGFKYNPQASEEASYDILQRPNDERMRNFNTQADLLGKGAGIEERDIANKRAIAQDITMDKIRQQQADTQSKKEKDIYETKQREDAARIEALDKQLAEKAREADQKSGDINSRLEIMRQTNDLTNQKIQLQEERHKLDLAERQRVHDATMANEQQKRTEAEKRAQLAEAALKQKSAPTTTTTTERTEGGYTIPFTNVHLGGHKVKEVNKSTNATIGSNNQVLQVPAGAKPGGKWVTTKSGSQVYVEP